MKTELIIFIVISLHIIGCEKEKTKNLKADIPTGYSFWYI